MNDLVGWVIALAAGVLVASVAYPRASLARLRPLLRALRTLAVVLLVALALDVAIGVARPPAPLVALDASASWTRGGDTAVWRLARDSATSAAQSSGDLLLFGDSVRASSAPLAAGDLASAVAPVVQRAAAAGRRLVVITDGMLDDTDALQQAPAGSRVVVLPTRGAADRAVLDLLAPGEARAGDTMTVRVRITADREVTRAVSVTLSLDGKVLVEAPVPALGNGGEAIVESRVVVPGGDSVAILRAWLPAGGDAEPRNDTASVVLRRGARQRIVIMSTTPDADIRDIATALRRNVALPTEAYFQVAPGRWLREGELSQVSESIVRAAVRGATLAVLHGDTAAMGAPGSLGTRALLLLSPPERDDAPELLVRTPSASPLQSALAGIVIDSLPPLLAVAPARGGIVALNAAPGLTVSGAIPIMTAIEGDVRRVLLTASGYSRWRARGGVSEVAFQALVGAATDWLLAARGRVSVPVLVAPLIRAGAPVVWRRGSRPRSAVILRRDGDNTLRRDSLRFEASATATIPPLTQGVWRGTVDGASVVIPVSASREWLPRPLTTRSGNLNGDAKAARRGARSIGWLYLATVLLLAAEWLLRRRAGLR